MKRIMLVITTVLVLASCGSSHVACDAYGVNSICNPENAEYVNEVAFNKGIPALSVTQEMFDERYSSGY
jgi:hypothetical protein